MTLVMEKLEAIQARLDDPSGSNRKYLTVYAAPFAQLLRYSSIA